MSKYFEIPCHNIISSYGGIGSLVETPTGSLMIQLLEKWPYFIHEVTGKDKDALEKISIHDKRLICKLQAQFRNISYLLSVPINGTSNNGNRVTQETMLVSAEYFPNWMFCPKCKRFMKYEDWLSLFRMNRLGKDFDLYCPHCRKPSHGQKPLRILLEQVRFIQVSEDGEISDFPWNEWFDNKASNLGSCEEHEFYYKSSEYSDNLESIRIYCKKCKASASLIGIFGTPTKGNKFRTVLKSSNSVYFPAIVRSLLIPVKDGSRQEVLQHEMDYRCQELDYLVKAQYDSSEEDELQIHLKALPRSNSCFSIASVRTLNMVSVLCSYSRLQPVAFGTIFDPAISRHVTKEGIGTKFLPCVQSSGEGFLIVFENSTIVDWYESALLNSDFKTRLGSHQKALTRIDFLNSSNNKDYAMCKYILLHTISHLLIKQLEYVCGYPATSLQERIYASSGLHAGIMIYTVSGSEGSFGGIVTMVERGDLNQILFEAIDKAMYCANDPVCYKQSSVCFSCSLLPETSCESFNSLLDRSFVVDRSYGFGNILGAGR